MVKEINKNGYADILHESILPFIELYFYARDGVFGWNFRLKRILLDDIIRQDPLLGLWASEKDVLQVVEEWNENIEDSSSSSWRFLCMMECMVKTGYKTDWDDLRQKTCHIAERGSVRKLSA